MDRVTGIQLFIRVVETGSFSRRRGRAGHHAADRHQGRGGAEKRLGARLLHRTTRGVTRPRSARCTTNAASPSRATSTRPRTWPRCCRAVGGTLRISTSVAFGRRVMVPLVLRYMRRHPAGAVDLSFDDRYVNLVEQGVDVALRMGRLADSSLGARYLGTNPWLMVAAPGLPEGTRHAAQGHRPGRHDCLVYSSVQGDDRWNLSAAGGETVAVQVKGPLRSNNLSAVLAAARQGMGLAILPWYVARESVEQGVVRQVLDDHHLPTQEVHAVFPSPKLVPSKVLHFIDWLAHALDGTVNHLIRARRCAR
jgi:DNA-binding transcriptional LysR family regulator